MLLSMWKRFLARQLLLCLQLPPAVNYSSSSKCLNDTCRALSVKLKASACIINRVVCGLISDVRPVGLKPWMWGSVMTLEWCCTKSLWRRHSSASTTGYWPLASQPNQMCQGIGMEWISWEWTLFELCELFQNVRGKAWSRLKHSAGYIVPRVEVATRLFLSNVMILSNQSMF